MSRIRPTRRAAATVIALAAGLAGVLTAAPTTADASTAAVQRPTTQLTVVLRGCDRCSVQLQHAIDGAGDTVWTSRSQTAGPDHEVTFRVPTRLTHGLSFVFHAPWEGGTGAVPNVVTRYAGQAVGHSVDRDAARHARRAEGCWAGTTADAARLTFQVDRVRTRTVDGHPTRSPLVYSARTLPSWKPLVKTYKGTIGNQDAFYCNQP
jgi:hypothetical protein